MCWNISRVLDALSLGPTLGPPSPRFEASPSARGEVAARAELTVRWPNCAPIRGVAFKSNIDLNTKKFSFCQRHEQQIVYFPIT